MFENGEFNFEPDSEIFTSQEKPAWHSYVDNVSRLVNDTVESVINSNGKQIVRTTSVGEMIDCYRNLNKPEFFSCKQRAGECKNLVSGYGKTVVIENPTFVVGEKSRLRILAQKRKNVHAFVRGEFRDMLDGTFTPDENCLEVTYNPYVAGHFFVKETGLKLEDNQVKRYAVLHGANVYLSDF